jgi:Ca-activated chloride channel family protein
MKKIILFALLAGSLAGNSPARETVKILTETDQGCYLVGSPQEVVVKIDLTACPDTKTKRTPLNLAVVIDRSGSMEGPKIEKARQAAAMIVDRLAPDDVFSLVAFDTTVEVLVPAQHVTDKDAIKRRIARIRPDGTTALYAGVETGARQLQEYVSSKRINRILLLSDGIANVGPSSPGELRQLGHRLASHGISVSTIGVGDDYNEDLMSGLAEASDANYYYVKDVETLPRIFAKELGSMMNVAARKIRIEVICPDGVHPIGFIGRPERFEKQHAAVELDNLTAGQNRYILLRCRAEEARKLTAREIARVKVSYLDELDNGRECSYAENVHVAFDSDPDVVKASANSTVIAQRELMVNALKIDDAIATADAGQLPAAAAKLNKQADWLDSQVQNAPAALQSQMNAQALTLRGRAQELEKGDYSSSTRKDLQSDSWNYRNSKQ